MVKNIIIDFLSRFKHRTKILLKYKNPKIKMSIFNENIFFGKNSYHGDIKIMSFTQKEKMVVGEYVSIADNVTFLLGGEHSYKGLSTYPFDKYVFGTQEKTLSKGQIVVEDDVWIGYGSLIMSGVTISKGTVIGSGSVVTKNTEPYGIYGGNPAKLIKYRFSEEIRNKLVNVDLQKLFKVVDNREVIYSTLTEEKLDELIAKMD